ncbi:MAG: hypothetical protein H6R07_2408 [Proteobacteria bacterium]|nr:hypothetical protein [Pseudomonadota bacterium]
MKLFQLFSNEERTVTPSRPAAQVTVLPGGVAGTPPEAPAAPADARSLAGAEWDGVERRSNPDRRSSDRRQQGLKGLLDTRTGDDRRHYGRRSTDHPPAGRLKIKV